MYIYVMLCYYYCYYYVLYYVSVIIHVIYYQQPVDKLNICSRMRLPFAAARWLNM